MERRCLNCNKHIIEGRSDKIYCSLKCKNEYHNKINKEKNRVFLSYENPLRRIRNILANHHSSLTEIMGLNIDELYEEGFKKDYITSTGFNNKTRENISWVYDYCYSINGNTIKIFKK